MRYLFLDIDGVCNSARCFSKETFLGEELVQRVNDLVRTLGCKVILSSSWRIGDSGIENTQKALDRSGATFKIEDKTPSLDQCRGIEIQRWMNEHAVGADQIIILDDDSDMEHLSPRLIQTTWADGIQPEHVEAALRLFDHE